MRRDDLDDVRKLAEQHGLQLAYDVDTDDLIICAPVLSVSRAISLPLEPGFLEWLRKKLESRIRGLIAQQAVDKTRKP